MAIRKNAKNIIVTVHEKYHLQVGGKLEKTASSMNVEAAKGILSLQSNKKIMSHGNKR